MTFLSLFSCLHRGLRGQTRSMLVLPKRLLPMTLIGSIQVHSSRGQLSQCAAVCHWHGHPRPGLLLFRQAQSSWRHDDSSTLLWFVGLCDRPWTEQRPRRVSGHVLCGRRNLPDSSPPSIVSVSRVITSVAESVDRLPSFNISFPLHK